MSKSTKIWLVIAASLMLAGCILFGGAMMSLKWDFTKLSTNTYETNRYEISEHYKNISIVTETADVVFVPSEDLKSSVVCYERASEKLSVTVKDGTLIIEMNSTKKWYEYIGINFGSPKITVSIPQGEYGMFSVTADTGNVQLPKDFKFESIDASTSTGNVKVFSPASELIKIKTSTGSIVVENISTGSLDLSVSTGKVTVSDVNCEGEVSLSVSTGDARLTNVSCKSLSSTGDTGDITLKNVIATEKLSIERSTGHVKFEGCDATELFIETDTGDVFGTLLSEKVFVTKTDIGRINGPDSITGGRCEITTDTGDIRITIQQ